MKYYTKNTPKWSDEEIIEEIKVFNQIYKERPIIENLHGMRFPHMFATYFILKKIKPDFVIESGIYKGQSTWLIEKTLPNAKILSIDLDLSQRIYISKKATYSDLDFKYQNFSNIPKNTLVFFDDHVNHYQRLIQSKFFNIKNIIFEDNYDLNKGDFYSLKHIQHNSGYNHKYTKLSLVKTFYVFLKEILKKLFSDNYQINLDKILFRLRDYKASKNDFDNINKNIEIYYEFPPLIDNGDISKKPLMNEIDLNLKVTREDLKGYNNLTYIKLH
tara:strand:+ start:534 stop:1352 length:819 start_codon:yes stop_codon:yes gene_type:complete